MQRRAAALRRRSLGKKFPAAKTSTSEFYRSGEAHEHAQGIRGKVRASTVAGAGRGRAGLVGELARSALSI
jgi:hypothetical protein